MAAPADAHAIAAAWLSTFAQATAADGAHGGAAMFLSDGWLRDVLTFAWNTRSLRRRATIAAYRVRALHANAAERGAACAGARDVHRGRPGAALAVWCALYYGSTFVRSAQADRPSSPRERGSRCSPQRSHLCILASHIYHVAPGQSRHRSPVSRPARPPWPSAHRCDS
ncbi:hypothetical protein PsYK624_154250 [Phanerochaete sordida]|uniref:Uncharacterized protein n=1 Tax=Phanerochaete sordida TaxID=48140 RepID=A0A9P3LMB2_9APHY|nr:hypothetical protein PsYK624_154250 [Phanerochaete sordida]